MSPEMHPQEVRRTLSRQRERVDGTQERFKRALSYTHTFQKETIRQQPWDDKEQGLIGLGDANFLVPNKERFTMLFYWDSYFMMQPLLHTQEGRALAKSTIHAFATLLDRFGLIPNASAMTYLGNSQAPFFSSMIIDTYEHMSTDEQLLHMEWLGKYMEYAKYEYATVWNNPKDYAQDGIGSYHHFLPEFGLSKYGDRDGDYSMNAERESGWDFTSRFGSVAMEFLPVDLNCFLYKYEMDFAKTAKILGKPEEEQMWLHKAADRQAKINQYMWNEEKGFFFDYNYVREFQSPFYSLAGFVPLWTGLATPEQALRVAEQLSRFSQEKGLMVTDKDSLPPPVTSAQLESIGITPFFQHRTTVSLGSRDVSSEEGAITGKQWDYPHVWAPTEYMAVVGLLTYANDSRLSPSDRRFLRDTARDLMEDYVNTLGDIFDTEGTFPEKFNGITGTSGNGFHYAKQSGFGWTNAVFQEFAQRLLPQIYAQEDYEQAITHPLRRGTITA